MSMTFLEAISLPDEFFTDHCGLCGNSGMVNTVGKVFTAANVECGVCTYCLCPNGRALKRAAEVNVRHEKPQTFWVSWDDYSWESPVRHGPHMIGSWESGQSMSGDYATIVAWVIGSTLNDVIRVVDAHYPCKGERRWRFITPKMRGDYKVSDRFPLDKRAQAIIAKLQRAKR